MKFVEHLAGVIALLGAFDPSEAIEIPIHQAHLRRWQAEQAVDLLRLDELTPVAGDEPGGLHVERLMIREMHLEGGSPHRILLNRRALILTTMIANLNVPYLTVEGEDARLRAVPQRV